LEELAVELAQLYTVARCHHGLAMKLVNNFPSLFCSSAVQPAVRPELSWGSTWWSWVWTDASQAAPLGNFCGWALMSFHLLLVHGQEQLPYHYCRTSANPVKAVLPPAPFEAFHQEKIRRI
jgi:hypothetical protein